MNVEQAPPRSSQQGTSGPVDGDSLTCPLIPLAVPGTQHVPVFSEVLLAGISLCGPTEVSDCLGP